MPADASWTWRYEGPDRSELDAAAAQGLPSPAFPTQADAESWLGEEWRDLLSAGVEAVHLYEADRHVYGPMSLRPAT